MACPWLHVSGAKFSAVHYDNVPFNLMLLQSKWPKLDRVLDILSAIRLSSSLVSLLDEIKHILHRVLCLLHTHNHTFSHQTFLNLLDLWRKSGLYL